MESTLYLFMAPNRWLEQTECSRNWSRRGQRASLPIEKFRGSFLEEVAIEQGLRDGWVCAGGKGREAILAEETLQTEVPMEKQVWDAGRPAAPAGLLALPSYYPAQTHLPPGLLHFPWFPSALPLHQKAFLLCLPGII